MSTTDIELPDPSDGITGPTRATARKNGGTNRSGGVTVVDPEPAEDDSPSAPAPAEPAPAPPAPTTDAGTAPPSPAPGA